MKYKDSIINILIAILILVNIYLLINQHKTISRYSKFSETANRIYVENIQLKEGFFHYYDYENTSMNYSAILESNDGNKIEFDSILLKKNWLILFIKVESCFDCIQDNIDSIKELNNKGMNVIIGIAGLNSKGFKTFIKQHDIEEFSYRLPENYFPEFEINPAVFFVVDKNLNSKYFFVPCTDFPELTQDYFNIVKQHINK